MKKILPFLSLALVLFACKKSNNSVAQPEEKKYEISFKIEDFNQAVVDIGKTSSKALAVGDTLKNYADNLYYRVYNSAGVLVNSTSQASSLATFGTITDKLPSGTYTVVLIASKAGVGFSSVSEPYNINFFYPSTGYWNDLFLKTITLSVTSSNISESVRLDRAVGAVEVSLQDAIPSNAAKISIVIQSDAHSIYPSGSYTSNGTARTRDFSISAADVGVKGKTFLTYVGNVSDASNVIIRAYDSSNGLLAEKTVTNVRVYKNKKTLLTGSLFPATSNPSIGFTVTVNPAWDIPSTPITF